MTDATVDYAAELGGTSGDRVPPTKDAPPPGSSPTEGMSGPSRFAAGMVKGLRDLGLGTAQVYMSDPLFGAGIPDIMSGGAFTKPLEAQAAENKKLDAPLMATRGGFWGDVVGQTVPAVATAPFTGGASLEAPVARLGAAALQSGILGGLRPTDESDSRVMNILISGGLGAAGQQFATTVGALVRGVPVPDAARQAAKEFVDQFGGVITRGQQGGSAFIQRMESLLASAPGSGRFFRNAEQENIGAATKAVRSVTGGDAGALIQGAGSGKSLTVDQAMIDELKAIEANYAGLPEAERPAVLKTIKQLTGTPGVPAGSPVPNPALAPYGPTARASAIKQGIPEFIPGTPEVPGIPGTLKVGDTMPMVGPKGEYTNYQNVRSLYGGKRVPGGGGDQADQAGYGAIQDAYDNAAIRSLETSGAPGTAMRDAHKAYAAQLVFNKGAIRDTEGVITGYDPQKIAAAVQAMDKNKPGFIDSLGDAGDMLRKVANFGTVTRPVKSSGTAEGNMAAKFLSLDMLKDVFTKGDPVTGLLTLGIPWAANTMLQRTRGGIPGVRDAAPVLGPTFSQIMKIAPPALASARRDSPPPGSEYYGSY